MNTIAMIFSMTGMTAIYVLITVLLWRKTRDREMTASWKAGIGIIFGLCAVLSTHYGVSYDGMILNVRDLGPLAAGLYFDPVSGIIAGIIGGVERYIAGTYWNVGAYTRIACSISTCLAGFVAAGMHKFIFKKEKPTLVNAYVVGAVMEAFHMYVVFITHHDDMTMAFHVVRTCAPPMITFTGLGLLLTSLIIRMMDGESKAFISLWRKKTLPVSLRFQSWLFIVTAVILLFNFFLADFLQTQTELQLAEASLDDAIEDVESAYNRIGESATASRQLGSDICSLKAEVIASQITGAGGISSVDESFIENLRETYDLTAILLVDEKANILISTGTAPLYATMLQDVLNGEVEQMTVMPSERWTVTGKRIDGGILEVVTSSEYVKNVVNLDGFEKALSTMHVGYSGNFEIYSQTGVIRAGNHMGEILRETEMDVLSQQETGVLFRATLFKQKVLCKIKAIGDDLTLLVMLPMEEVYASRDAQAYETALADIVLFAVIYFLISLLVQQIVVDNLQRVNTSLDRIADGNLDEVVNVRTSYEFSSLSDDINQTVDVLKGYIDAAEKRIERELEFAYAIQDAALPKNFVFPNHHFELFAMMDPAKEVGGDFYDFFFADQTHLGLVIADVSGKGIPASLFMMRSMAAIRGYAMMGLSPAEILFRANNALCEGNSMDMFVTVWVGIIDLETGLMKCANAGHEYPAIMRAGGEFELLHDKHGFVLASLENMKQKEYELQLNPGDRLFVYTDGVPEAIDKQEEQYGTDRLIEELNRVREKPMNEILPDVRKNISDFVGDADQFDDITMLGFTFFNRDPEMNLSVDG